MDGTLINHTHTLSLSPSLLTRTQTFCASHARAVKLMADEKTALNEWLQKRSAGQISQSLESYLIRPIQRVLKYPLLLTQMKALCAKGTVNHHKLEEAVKELEKGEQ